MKKAQRMNPAQLNQLTDEVFPLVATSFTSAELLEKVTNVAQYHIVETTGFPFDDGLTTGMIGNKGSCVVPVDLTSNVTELHHFLYPEVEYTPSSSVISYSQKIHDDTAPYVGR
jgi:hypothetical protein